MTGAIDVSADGSIVVGGNEEHRHFVWSAATGPVRIDDLPSPPGVLSELLGLSDDGAFAVGRVRAETRGDPMRWSQRTGVELLGNLEPDPGSGDYRAAEAASADGSVVVGRSNNRAFRWTAEDGMVALGGLPGVPGPHPFGAATDVSADGSVIVGHTADGFGGIEAFRWTADRGMQGLGVKRHAFAVSADGSVISGDDFRWTEAEGAVPVGGLPGGQYPMYAYDLSGDGSLMVGLAGTATPFHAHAVVWHASVGVRDLAELLTRDYGLDLGDWHLGAPTIAISADGHTIVGSGGSQGQLQGWRATLALRCLNGEDDDGDGAIDFPSDPGCAAPLDGGETVDCANDADDDGDGLVDTADPGCQDAADGSEVNATSECDDHVDNDRDGVVDFPTDPGCSAPDDASELGECQDGVDNDADGFVDLGDAGCTGPTDPSEFLATACGNGVDDDGDGRVDMDDPGCPSPIASPENPGCDNGADDDGDGAIDFADTGCTAEWPYWETAPCGIGAEIALVLPLLGWLRRRAPAATPPAPSP